MEADIYMSAQILKQVPILQTAIVKFGPHIVIFQYFDMISSVFVFGAIEGHFTLICVPNKTFLHIENEEEKIEVF